MRSFRSFKRKTCTTFKKTWKSDEKKWKMEQYIIEEKELQHT